MPNYGCLTNVKDNELIVALVIKADIIKLKAVSTPLKPKSANTSVATLLNELTTLFITVCKSEFNAVAERIPTPAPNKTRLKPLFKTNAIIEKRNLPIFNPF
jgi:hypothetical protein